MTRVSLVLLARVAGTTVHTGIVLMGLLSRTRVPGKGKANSKYVMGGLQRASGLLLCVPVPSALLSSREALLLTDLQRLAEGSGQFFKVMSVENMWSGPKKGFGLPCGGMVQ